MFNYNIQNTLEVLYTFKYLILFILVQFPLLEKFKAENRAKLLLFFDISKQLSTPPRFLTIFNMQY